MGNNINIGNAQNSNVVSGDVHGNVSAGNGSDNEAASKKNVPEIGEALQKQIESPSAKKGLVLAILFVLSMIVLFVITR